MDQLWAPWRLEYVCQPEKQADGCFLCAAAQSDDDRESMVLWRGSHCFCLLNRWPYNNGHLLVAPYAHCADLCDLAEPEVLEQVQMLRRAQGHLREVLDPGGFNVGLNLGSAAGAGLESHLHWHVVPRWAGDTNFMPALADTKVIPQSLDHLWRLLRGETVH